MLLFATILSAALADDCEALAAKAPTLAPAEVAPTFQALVACDAGLASEKLPEFVHAAKDLDALEALVIVAANAQVPTAMAMLEPIADGSVRDQVAAEVGAKCVDNPGITAWLGAAWPTAKGRQVGMWRKAYIACQAPTLDPWMEGLVAKPPASPLDEKYQAALDIYVGRKKAAGMAVLTQAAIAASHNGGPLGAVLDAMIAAARGGAPFGAVPDAARPELEGAIGEVAKAAPPEGARLAAEKLYQTGSTAAAAALLPVVYKDRVQSDGNLLYGVAAIESCDGAAVVHWASLTEPGKRWSIVDDATAAVKAWPPKLKCTDAPTVVTTPEPQRSAGEVEAWATALSAQWAKEKKVEAKGKEEKAVALP